MTSLKVRQFRRRKIVVGLVAIPDLFDLMVQPGFRDQVIGQGDGTQVEFALTKTYLSGAERYERPIAKPVEGSVKIGVGDAEQFEGVHFELDAARGVVTLSQAPGPDDFVTAGFEFDVPVRFDTDRIHTSVASFQAGDVPNVPVIEVRV